MNKYINGKIYKLKCNTTGKIYIGSTTRKYLSERLASHNSNYKQYLNNEFGYLTSFEILSGNNYEITLIESFPCNNKDELNARERFFIETTLCVNKYHPGRTREEYKTENIEAIKSYQTEYRLTNKEKLKTDSKEYYKNNKEKWIVKTKCDLCDVILLSGKIARHNKTKKHMEAMAAQI